MPICANMVPDKLLVKTSGAKIRTMANKDQMIHRPTL
jgi:hypothetical protein